MTSFRKYLIKDDVGRFWTCAFDTFWSSRRWWVDVEPCGSGAARLYSGSVIHSETSRLHLMRSRTNLMISVTYSWP